MIRFALISIIMIFLCECFFCMNISTYCDRWIRWGCPAYRRQGRLVWKHLSNSRVTFVHEQYTYIYIIMQTIDKLLRIFMRGSFCFIIYKARVTYQTTGLYKIFKHFKFFLVFSLKYLLIKWSFGYFKFNQNLKPQDLLR